MRDYGKLHCEFWTSPTIQGLSDDGKIMAAYLLTNQHCTLIGAYRLPDGYVCDDLGWSLQRVAKGFGELLANGFITRCEASKFIKVSKYLDYNPLENPNQVKAGIKVFEKLPDSLSGKGDLAKALGVDFKEPLANPSETLSKPVAVTVAVAVTEDKSIVGQKSPDPVVTAKDQKETALRVIDFLNAKAGKAFRHVPANINFVVGRLREGASEQDCKQVIAKKTREWKGTDQAQYLRPETLFNATKFAQYVGELVVPTNPWDGAK